MNSCDRPPFSLVLALLAASGAWGLGAFTLSRPLGAEESLSPPTAPEKLAPPTIAVPVPSPSDYPVTGGKNQAVDRRPYPVQPGAIGFEAPKASCETVIVDGQLQRANCGNLAGGVAPSSGVPPTIRFEGSPAGASFAMAMPPVPSAIAKVLPAPQLSRVYHQATKILQQQLPQANTTLFFPVSVPASISSAFGWRTHPISGKTKLHSGTDIAAPYGTPVVAAYPGKVQLAGPLQGYGLIVILRHQNQTQESRYAHLSEYYVQPGQWVEQGQVIGAVGNTGLSTGPHLHFEWREKTAAGWVAVNAGEHLAKAQRNLGQALQLAVNPQTPQGRAEIASQIQALNGLPAQPLEDVVTRWVNSITLAAIAKPDTIRLDPAPGDR